MSSINCSLIRCAKLICRSHDVSLSSNTYSVTGIMPFHSMVARANALCMHKLIYQNSLPYYSSVKLLREISSRETRGTLNNKILPVKVSRTIDEHCFDVSAKEYKYYKKVHLLFGLLKNVLRRILLPPCSRGKEITRCPMRNAHRADAKISHPMRVRGVYFRWPF